MRGDGYKPGSVVVYIYVAKNEEGRLGGRAVGRRCMKGPGDSVWARK